MSKQKMEKMSSGLNNLNVNASVFVPNVNAVEFVPSFGKPNPPQESPQEPQQKENTAQEGNSLYLIVYIITGGFQKVCTLRIFNFCTPPIQACTLLFGLPS